MWSIRILNGPWAGQVFPLKEGPNRLGRSPSCDIQLMSSGISKEHATFEVRDDRVYVTDLQSSNGTFVNGVRVVKSVARVGDKFSLHDLLFDIVPSSVAQQLASFRPSVSTKDYNAEPVTPSPQAIRAADFQHKVKNYIDQVVLEGVYRLPEYTEFKIVLAIFTFILVLGITLLSIIPMSSITKTSIEKESRRRALTIARNMAYTNQQLLVQGLESNLSTTAAQNEEGVSEAVIVAELDGTILAPALRAGTQPDNAFFVRARREQKEFVAQIDSNTIGASVPIYAYNAQIASQTVKGFAIVIYDMGSLAYDDGAAFSLFIQTLFMASLLGALWYFFVYKLVEKPFHIINQKIDATIAQKNDITSSRWQWPIFQKSLSNINSVLTRMINGDDSSQNALVDKTQQIANLVQLVGYPAVAVNGSGQIIMANQNFETLTGAQVSLIQGQEISQIPDKNLQKAFYGLFEQSRNNPQSIVNTAINIDSNAYTLYCQNYPTSQGEVEFLLFAVGPASQEQYGGAA